jgi:hypothetical protein
MLVLAILLIWVALSIMASLALGAFLRRGHRPGGYLT